MAIEVEPNKTNRVQPTETPQSTGLDAKDDAAVRNAADRVDAAAVAAKIDNGDRFDKVDAPTNGGIPLGIFTGTSSPVDSSNVVNEMGKLGALGTGQAAKFDASKYKGVVPQDPGAAFTGSGATGVSPTQSSIPVSDLAALARYDQGEKDLENLYQQRDELEDIRYSARPEMTDAMRDRQDQMLDLALDRNEGDIRMTHGVMDALRPTVDSYRNALSAGTATGDPKDLWNANEREKQAGLLLEQPISTIHGDAYGDKLPTRAEVIDAAAKKYDLDPNVLAGVILHEQRDQSMKEDAADFGGATLAGRDTSIGLGQVLMSTAMKNDADVLADTVDPNRRASLSRGEVARLLSSDEHNIFATARYLRSVADGAPNAGALPETQKEFPGFDPNGYTGRNWSDANIRAIASEYTSKPWDEKLIPAAGYPQFVLDAVEDVRRTGIFGR